MWLPIWPNKRTEMNEIALANRAADWRRLKALVLDSVSSPITKRVYNLGLDEFFAWYGQEARPGFTKATVSAWRVALEARGLGSVSINVRVVVQFEAARLFFLLLVLAGYAWAGVPGRSVKRIDGLFSGSGCIFCGLGRASRQHISCERNSTSTEYPGARPFPAAEERAGATADIGN
jgi:hypothetical protein